MIDLLTVKPSAETFAAVECARMGFEARRADSGLLAVSVRPSPYPAGMCFPSWRLENVQALDGKPAADWYCEAIRDERIDAPWPAQWLSASENGYAMNLAKTERLLGAMRKRVSRIAKLASTEIPAAGRPLYGLFILESPECGCWASRSGFFFGQRRMADDPAAPSRSYLKIEEAFAVMGRSPRQGESVADLGAAPGGWSWAAAKRGATVMAVDNGPLKKAALGHPLIRHLPVDAFAWTPQSPVDWLLCDVVEDPMRVLKRVRLWFSRKWCRFAVVNFKYGRTDPNRLLARLTGREGLAPLAKRALFRHLFHDRDEFTLMAELSTNGDRRARRTPPPQDPPRRSLCENALS